MVGASDPSHCDRRATLARPYDTVVISLIAEVSRHLELIS